MVRGRGVLLSCFVGFCAVQAAAQSADLLISKSGPESATAGDNVVYSIYAFNGGPAAAENVTVTDALPSGTTFVSLAATTAVFTCSTPAVGSGGTVMCTAPTLPNQGDTNFTLTVKTSASAPNGMINNTATIASATSDPNASDDSSTVTTGIAAIVTAFADLSIDSMAGSSNVNSGGTMSVQVTVSNRGPSTAHHVQFVNAVPANATFAAISVFDPLAAFTCTTPSVGTSGSVTCNAAVLDPSAIGEQPVFTLTFRVNDGVAVGTALMNTATISADEADPNTANNTASRNAAVASQPASADVSVAVTGGSPTFNVTVHNNGPNDAAAVTLTDNVPGGSTFAGWTQTSGPPFNCTTPSVGDTGTITCSIGVLAGFSTAVTTAEFALSINPFATFAVITDTATVTSNTPDPNPTNNTSTFPVQAYITIAGVTVTEGNSGTTPAVFTVMLQPANPTLTATVHYKAVGLTATAGSDFAATEGTLTFSPGETLKTITVPVFGDTIPEGNETFVVQLSDAVNAVLQSDTAIGTIVDDDQGAPPVPSVAIADIVVTEGNSGTTNATFTAQLSFASAAVSRVRWQTQDGTASAGSDYIASNGEVVFQPGELSKSFTVPVLGDTLFEPDETFSVVITGSDNTTALPGQMATCTIKNDDAQIPPRHRAARH
jgi:uncharacterized repeat protein (TIGR01451 family)